MPRMTSFPPSTNSWTRNPSRTTFRWRSRRSIREAASSSSFSSWSPNATAWSAVAVHGERPLRPLVPFAILPVTIHRGERSRGALREQIRGDAMAHEFHETGTVLGPAEEVAQHGLGVRLRGLPHCAGDVHLVD